MSNTKLKCPFCNEKLDNDDVLCSCINEYCEESFDMVGTEMIWQKVIDLKEELDRTRKALDVAMDAMKKSNEIVYSAYGSPLKTLKDALKQINKITKGVKQNG